MFHSLLSVIHLRTHSKDFWCHVDKRIDALMHEMDPMRVLSIIEKFILLAER